MRKSRRSFGFTFMEILLTIAVFATLSLASYPYWSEAVASINDGIAEQMTKNIISHAKSLAIAGQPATFTFQANGTIIMGENSYYKLPSNFTIEGKDVGKDFSFDICGSLTSSIATITIKRDDGNFKKDISVR